METINQSGKAQILTKAEAQVLRLGVDGQSGFSLLFLIERG